MKKLLFLLAATLMLVACNKDVVTPDVPVDPEPPIIRDQIVNIVRENVGKEEFSCRFLMADSCVSYTIMAAETGTQEQFLPMFGYSCIEDAVEAWGITYTTDTSYTWTEMTPNTSYTVYVVAKTATARYLVTDTLVTCQLGGSGVSEIHVAVTNIESHGCTTTASPNSETALFKDFIVTKAFYDQVGRDSIESLLKEDPYTHYSSDVWIWTSLDPSTDYLFLAIGQNANGIWGPMSSTSFRTTTEK